MTDLDAGGEGVGAVTQAEVFRVFAQSTERLRTLLLDLLVALPEQRTCPCGSALDGIDVELP